MSLSLDGATGNITGLAVLRPQLPAGGISQVVQGSTSTEVEVITTTYTDTGLSATITPTSASSKILVFVDQQAYWAKNTIGQGLGIKIFRNSTEIYKSVTDSSGSFDSYSGYITNLYTRVNVQILDSPGSTSALTYKIQGRPYYSSDSGKAEFNTAATNTNATSFITLVEVAG